MPQYEFACRNCKKVFSQLLALVDDEEADLYSLKIGSREDEVCCRQCGSTDVEQRWSVFDALTSKNAA